MTDEDRSGLLNRISFTTSFDELTDRDLVIEAVVESPSVKASVFKTLDEIVQKDGILASNTSSISIGEIANPLTSRGPQVLGMHFLTQRLCNL